MIWNLNCRKTRRLLALSADNDFTERPAPEIDRHLAVCPRCRETWQGLRNGQQALQRLSIARFEEARLEETRLEEARAEATRAGGESPVSERPSLWPGVAQHLRGIDEQSAAPDWRGWLPSGALAAACLAVVVVTVPDPQFGVRTADGHRPLVISPQHASADLQGPALRGLRAPVADWDREVPEVDDGRGVRVLPGDDEPRSF
jgi:hypothetical protein